MKKIIQLILDFLAFLFPGLEDNVKTNEKHFIKKQYLTNSELTFYNKLIKLEELGDYKIVPQVNLATIISKISNNRYQSELYRNIDFAIFNNDFSQLHLLIELNDSSHNQKSRIMRDKKVKDICEQANIKLMTFHTKYENKPDYIINRILNEITEKKDN